jgi:hypothetical protein
VADLSPDGLYFGLDEDVYHGEPRLSASLMKWLRVSSMDCWARSWMNPEREEDEDTDAKELGRAYHKRILEGASAFRAAYAASLDKADYPDALVTADDLRKELAKRDLKVSGNKPDLIARLLADDPKIQIWDDLVAKHEAANEGRALINFKEMKRIEIAGAMISCFWTDAATGVKLKARYDYLKVTAVVDLKTFANQNSRPIDRAIYAAMANNRYHIQAAHYLDSVEFAREFARTGEISGEPDPAWLAKFAAGGDPTFLFIWQQTGLAPVAIGRTFPRTSMYQIGQRDVREYIELFASCVERFGSDPWIHDAPIEALDDALYPAYATE